MNENQLKTKILNYIRKAYPSYWVYKTSDRWQSGIPDILICTEGRLIAIELKIHPNKPTPIQKYVLNAINTAGGMAVVCYSLDEVKKLLTKKEL